MQQIIQVAGRAGRQTHDSLVIVQAMADHAIFSYLQETEYSKFYEYEIKSRAELGYPPCSRLVELELRNSDETVIERDAYALVSLLLEKKTEHIQILGPSRPLVSKIKNIHMRKVYIKGSNINAIIDLIKTGRSLGLESSLLVTPNPVH